MIICSLSKISQFFLIIDENDDYFIQSESDKLKKLISLLGLLIMILAISSLVNTLLKFDNITKQNRDNLDLALLGDSEQQ
jgi:hypothetical protein